MRKSKRRKRSKSSKGKQVKPLTRNIFPDLLRVFKVLLISFLIVVTLCTIVDEAVPFVKGYSLYTCSTDFQEYGYYQGDTLILKKGLEGISLVRSDEGVYTLQNFSDEHSIGTIVYSFNIFKKSIHIYNNILGMFKN